MTLEARQRVDYEPPSCPAPSRTKKTSMPSDSVPLNLIVFADLKAAVALRSGFSHAVEDSLRHARNYAAAGVRCFLVKAGAGGWGRSAP